MSENVSYTEYEMAIANIHLELDNLRDEIQRLKSRLDDFEYGTFPTDISDVRGKIEDVERSLWSTR